MNLDKLDSAVGLSRKWDAREAGREVAKNTIKKLGAPPKFFVLFSSIHYKDHGGFQELLNGVWDVLPKGTPLIGCTVLAFMNNYGCYARGVTAIASSYQNMDVVAGIGKNTKRNPRKAAKNSSDIIEQGLKSSSFKNRFILNLVSGPMLMAIPGQGYKKVIDSGFMSKFVSAAFGMSQYLLQKGVSREDEVIEKLIENLPDYKMILGTSYDFKGIENYQFYNDKIYTNCLVNLGFSTDLELDISTSHGMKKTDHNFKITKLSKNGHIIHKINGKPAVRELHKIQNWPDDFLDENTMLHKILYYPISPTWHGQERPTVLPYILKDSIMTSCLIEEGDASVLTVNGKNIINAIDTNLDHFLNIEPTFGLCSSCMTIIQAIGNKAELIREEMIKYFNEKPFIMFYCAGEGTYSPETDINYANMSFNTAVFGKKANKNQVKQAETNLNKFIDNSL